ncbi:MAG: twin-arginine translocase TatA/TatE family subunit [Bacteroidia bacterium]|nr:twin-arginine translocase TatA/TatE family subunit [Bacteroidia bacterium]MCZ2248036.1 twin-arginine translocase TatA/TatE family subunit [Bacteroidia bacterium]
MILLNLLFLNLGGSEVMLILVVVLLFFGSKNIPNLARGLGKGMREFRDAADGIKKEIEQSAEPVTDEMKKASQNIQKEIDSHLNDNSK